MTFVKWWSNTVGDSALKKVYSLAALKDFCRDAYESGLLAGSSLPGQSRRWNE
jgi:hypothetical protein